MIKAIPGYNGYSISEYGIVYNKHNRILKPYKTSAGYIRICLFVNGHKTTVGVHKLVALAFIAGYKKELQVNHKDENKENNHYSNLEWVTPQYNSEYSKSKIYVFINPQGEKVEVFNLRKFCRENNLHQGHMNAVHQEKQHFHQHKGWRKS